MLPLVLIPSDSGSLAVDLTYSSVRGGLRKFLDF